MRRPSIKTSVSLGSKPRREMDDAPGVLPGPLFEVGTPLGPATVVFLINSSAVRSPDFSIKSRLIVNTGFGPTSSAVGMFEPVTMTRSTSAIGGGATGTSCPKLIDARTKKIPPVPNQARQINDCLNRSSSPNVPFCRIISYR